LWAALPFFKIPRIQFFWSTTFCLTVKDLYPQFKIKRKLLPKEGTLYIPFELINTINRISPAVNPYQHPANASGATQDNIIWLF
jgi:hypothetical protein